MGTASAQLPASVFGAKEVVLVTEGGGEVKLDAKGLYEGAAAAQLVPMCGRELAILPSAAVLSSDGVFRAEYLHSGGCAPHVYCVGYSVEESRGEALVWMGHKVLGEDFCKMAVEGRVELALPKEVMDAKAIKLFQGEGVVTKVLR